MTEQFNICICIKSSGSQAHPAAAQLRPGGVAPLCDIWTQNLTFLTTEEKQLGLLDILLLGSVEPTTVASAPAEISGI